MIETIIKENTEENFVTAMKLTLRRIEELYIEKDKYIDHFIKFAILHNNLEIHKRVVMGSKEIEKRAKNLLDLSNEIEENNYIIQHLGVAIQTIESNINLERKRVLLLWSNSEFRKHNLLDGTKTIKNISKESDFQANNKKNNNLRKTSEDLNVKVGPRILRMRAIST